MSNEEVKVSVCVVTYNQEQYIEECLQSLVDQETNFNFEVIVSDDCSTDKTTEIIKDFQKRYPDIIKPIFHKKNIGAFENFLFVHNQAKGEYVAHMDGDDYALPGKLKKQADYLDNKPKCNIVWTHILIEKQNGERYKQNKEFIKFVANRKFYKSDLIKFGTLGCNSTKMYRNGVYEPTNINFPIIDYYINIEQVGEGYACFVVGEPLGVYRLGLGISSVGNKTRNIWLNNIRILFKNYKEYKVEFNSILLTILLSDIVNRRETIFKSLGLYFSTFHLKGIFNLIKNYKKIKSFNFYKNKVD